MEIRDNGRENPLLIIPVDEVIAWLRGRADDAGYADREMCAVQITVEIPFVEGKTFHHECPSLVVMVSNIKNSSDKR